MLNRRRLIQLAGLSPFVRAGTAFAEDLQFQHATSLFDDIKYPAGFKSFDYVNPTAPKGGKVKLAVFGSFDSLNNFTLKGDSAGIGTLDTLMVRSADEPSTMYGLIAESIAYPQDKSRVVFRLNPAARFHDGHPITPEDVIYSLSVQKTNLASAAAYYASIEKGEQTGEHEVTFFSREKNNRELPNILAELVVMPKHWWTANGPDGKPRNPDEPSLELPLGSGAYRFKSVSTPGNIVLERVADYWAKDLPVNIGQGNFDEISYAYFQSPQVAFEGFKGGQSDYQYETSSKQWATGYDFPAVKDGRVKLEKPVLKQVHGMQGYVINLRKPKFQDVRVRRALGLAFDFEWSNANLFYGQYTHSRSFFNGSELEAKGLPSPEELALLEPLRDQLPAEVFTTEYQNPVNADAAARRKNLLEATKLLEAAGWKAAQDGGKRVLKNDKGEKFEIEFMFGNPLFERITLPFKEQLELLGFAVTVRSLDVAQEQKRLQTFDYDIAIHNYGQSLSPGNEQRDFWGSATADKNGSKNYCGIKNPAIDTLIEKLTLVTNRKELVTVCRALDRALIWNFYVIPQWFGAYERIAYWDRFGRPEKFADYGPLTSLPGYWWWDEEKAKKISG